MDIGIVTSIELNHKQIETARKGQEVCIKIESCGGEAPKMFGRHFDETDLLVSKVCKAFSSVITSSGIILVNGEGWKEGSSTHTLSIEITSLLHIIRSPFGWLAGC